MRAIVPNLKYGSFSELLARLMLFLAPGGNVLNEQQLLGEST